MRVQAEGGHGQSHVIACTSASASGPSCWSNTACSSSAASWRWATTPAVRGATSCRQRRGVWGADQQALPRVGKLLATMCLLNTQKDCRGVWWGGGLRNLVVWEKLAGPLGGQRVQFPGQDPTGGGGEGAVRHQLFPEYFWVPGGTKNILGKAGDTSPLPPPPRERSKNMPQATN